MADEIGSTPHTHIYVCFRSRVRFSTVKRHFKKAHIDACKGTASDNIAYVQKSGKWADDKKHETVVEGTFEEFGDRPSDSKGKKIDMTELYHMIGDGMTTAEILAVNQDYILHIDKIEKVRTVLLQEKYKNERRLDIHVVYIYGATRTGKTRGVLDEYGDGNVFRVSDYLHSFDGYNCEKELMFDEFRSSLKLSDMLQYLDVYPTELPARYSNKFACYDRVFIVSNWALEKQYSELQKTDKESWEAFLARIHEVWHYTAPGKVVKYDSVDAYMNRDEWTELKPNDDNPFEDADEFMELADDDGQSEIPFD